MQKEKVAESFFDRDLKEAVSEVRRNEYRKAAEAAARDPLALNVIELKVRTDFKLTQDDRIQLLADIESLSAQGSNAEAAGVFRGDKQRTATR